MELVHVGLWGPAPCLSSVGFRYYICFTDHSIRYSWLYPLHTKSKALSCFIKFKTMVELQLRTYIKLLQTNGRGEFKAFHIFLQSCGILHCTSCPHVHEQNGLAERKHRHIVEVGLTLLTQSHLPLKL